MTLQLLAQQLVNAVALGSIYAMIAVGLALVYGVLRILHVAQAGLYSAGAFIGLFLYQITGNFLLALLAAMILAGILGVFIERFVYRPMLARPRIVALIASIGLMICFSDVFRIIAGPNQLAFDTASLRGGYAVAGVVISKSMPPFSSGQPPYSSCCGSFCRKRSLASPSARLHRTSRLRR